MRELTFDEVASVSGGETNWNAVFTTASLIGISMAAVPAMPFVATTAAISAAGMGIYSAWSSWY